MKQTAEAFCSRPTQWQTLGPGACDWGQVPGRVWTESPIVWII